MALTKINLANFVTGTLADGNIPDNITIDVASASPANALTGNTLASGVTASSLTSVGTLTTLQVGGQNSTPKLEWFYDHSNGNDYKANISLAGNDLEVRGSNGTMEFYTGAVDGASSTKALSIDSSQNVKIEAGSLQLNDVAQSIDFIQSGAINFDSNNDQTGRVLTFGINRSGDSGGTEIARFTEDGQNFLIGTTDNDARLMVKKVDGTSYGQFVTIEGDTTDNNNYPGISFKGGDLANAYPEIGVSNGGLMFQMSGGYHSSNYNNRTRIQLNGNAGTISFQTGGDPAVEKMSITSSGFVGIGASPNALLDINKSTTSTSAPTGDESHEGFRLMLANPSLTNYATNALGFSMYNGEVCATIDASTLYDGNYKTGIRFQTRNDASGGLTEKVNINYGGNLIVRNNEVGNAGLIRNATSASYGDDAYNSITSGEAGAFMLYAYDYASGQGACFFCNYSDTVVKVAGHSNWTNSDSDGYYCVFKSSGSHTVTVKNRIGSTKNLGLLLVGVNPRQGA